MKNKMISHEEVMRIARLDPEFVKEERKLKPFYELANQIYLMRKKKKISQKDLAKKSKTFQTRISKIENGDLNPNLSTIIDIAESLGCTISISLNECPDEREVALSNNWYFYNLNQDDNEKMTDTKITQTLENSPMEDYVDIREIS